MYVLMFSLQEKLQAYIYFFIIQGWTIPAAAMPKDFLSADLRNKAGITTKPFLVNLTFWEDRPRLNFWEKILLKRKQLAKQAKNEAKEEEISAYMAEVSALNILFLSNHNIHKSLFGLCFWASDSLIERF